MFYVGVHVSGKVKLNKASVNDCWGVHEFGDILTAMLLVQKLLHL